MPSFCLSCSFLPHSYAVIYTYTDGTALPEEAKMEMAPVVAVATQVLAVDGTIPEAASDDERARVASDLWQLLAIVCLRDHFFVVGFRFLWRTLAREYIAGLRLLVCGLYLVRSHSASGNAPFESARICSACILLKSLPRGHIRSHAWLLTSPNASRC